MITARLYYYGHKDKDDFTFCNLDTEMKSDSMDLSQQVLLFVRGWAEKVKDDGYIEIEGVSGVEDWYGVSKIVVDCCSLYSGKYSVIIRFTTGTGKYEWIEVSEDIDDLSELPLKAQSMVSKFIEDCQQKVALRDKTERRVVNDLYETFTCPLCDTRDDILIRRDDLSIDLDTGEIKYKELYCVNCDCFFDTAIEFNVTAVTVSNTRIREEGEARY